MLTHLKKTFSSSRHTTPMSRKMTLQKSKVKVPSKTQKTAIAKKAVSVRVQKTDIVCAEGEQCFWSCDGRVLTTLYDLKDALADMSAESYAHHTAGRNDFANWTECVLRNDTCARALRTAKTQKAAIAVLTKLLSR